MEQIDQYLTFSISREEYALSVSNVKEILEVPPITRIPRMPPFMTGVFNLRGNVVPLIDLRAKFGLGATEMTVETAIVVIEIPTAATEGGKLLTLGIFAEAVHKVITLDAASIESPPNIGLDVDTKFIQGIGRVDDRFITILSITEIMSQGEIEEHLVPEKLADATILSV